MSETVSTMLSSAPPAVAPAQKPGSSPSINVSVPRHVAIVSGADVSSETLESAIVEAVDGVLSRGVACLSVVCKTLNPQRVQQLNRAGVRITGTIESSAMVVERLRLHLLSNADGGDDISEAVRRLSEKVLRGELSPDALTTAMLAAEIDRDDLPPVDLLLHTAEAKRLSRVLLWKAAYAELYFSPTYWKAFRQSDMLNALADYAGRRRTFGGLATS